MLPASLRRVLCAIPFVLAACTTTPPRDAAPALQPFAPSGAAKRVVLISFDGLGADALAEQPDLRSFEWMRQAGTAARVVTVNPTQTSVAHATILTGAPADRHGIVANRFHLPGTPFTETSHGFNVDLSAETLLEAARRQGRRVGSLAFPTIDGRTARRTADFGLYWSMPVVRPHTISLTRRNFRGEWVPPTWTRREPPYPSFSPVMRARVDCGRALTPPMDVQLVVYDTTDDRHENYDALIVEASGHEVPVDARGWFALTRRAGDGLQGSWSRIVAIEPDLSSARIYCGAFATTAAYPDAFRAVVEEEAGFWPGEPDAAAGAEIFREQVERFSNFFTRLQTATIRRMPFDLLLAYQPHIDESFHSFLITQPSQKSYTPESSAVAAGVRRAAFEATDRAIASTAAALDLTSDALVVVGDHGLTPVDTELRVNRLLAENGFLERWRAFASGNVTNVYRTAGGSDDTAQLAEVFRRSGFFELVRTKNAASHPNSGDLVATAYPNVMLSPSSEAPLTAPPRENGSHGALNTHRELHTVFFAVGAGVPKRDGGEIPQTKIARYVATLLGIGAPSSAE